MRLAYTERRLFNMNKTDIKDYKFVFGDKLTKEDLIRIQRRVNIYEELVEMLKEVFCEFSSQPQSVDEERRESDSDLIERCLSLLKRIEK